MTEVTTPAIIATNMAELKVGFPQYPTRKGQKWLQYVSNAYKTGANMAYSLMLYIMIELQGDVKLSLHKMVAEIKSRFNPLPDDKF